VSVDRVALGAERDFLLGSLEDLEAERRDGNIDDDTYRVLHDDYTARAAAVIRTLEDGVERPAARVPTPRALRLVTIGAIVVFCVVAAVLLARAVGERVPGGTITGNDDLVPRTTAGDRAAALRAAVEAEPRSYDARIAYARLLRDRQDFAGAIEQYSAAARLDATQPEPLTYRGWITALVARELDDERTRQELLGRATADLDRAIAADPDYGPAYVFKGIVLVRILDRPADAVAPLQRYLVLAAPEDPMRPQVLDLLAEAQAAATSRQEP
jgi:tetratricopeptide (TPR) repeat protein